MGNAPDKTIDKGFMLQTEKLINEFLSEQPLFHVEDIQFPLSTDEMKIVDFTGRRVKLAGGNWSGGHMCRHCVDGLECRPMKDIAMDIRFKLKMNCIRLTYSLQLIFDNNLVPQKYLKANPDLIGKTSMQIFDITVQTLTEVGLMVILNNHTSTSQWCCSNDDGDGLWWSRQYPQYLFFQHVEMFAKRYKDNPRVIGMDMRNQIRKAHGLDPTWGDGNPKTDWKRAAEKSAQIALAIAPHWLIFIGGINYQLDLTGVKENPIQLSVPHKLVYTGHFYGFSWPIPSWSVYTYENFKKRLFNTQTYVRSLGFPFLLGEYGNNNQDIPWQYLMKYLKQTDIDWTYWALDGFKCDPQKDETYGVFTNDFSQARHPQMLQDMIKVGPPLTALENYDNYLPKPPGKQEQSVIQIQDVPSQSVTNQEQISTAEGGTLIEEEPPIKKQPKYTLHANFYEDDRPLPAVIKRIQKQKAEKQEKQRLEREKAQKERLEKQRLAGLEKKKNYFQQLGQQTQKPQPQHLQPPTQPWKQAQQQPTQYNPPPQNNSPPSFTNTQPPQNNPSNTNTNQPQQNNPYSFGNDQFISGPPKPDYSQPGFINPYKLKNNQTNPTDPNNPNNPTNPNNTQK